MGYRWYGRLIQFSDRFESIFKVPLVHFMLETVLLAVLVILWRTKSFHPHRGKINLLKEEEEALINEWEPVPLVEPNQVYDYITPCVIEEKLGHYATINGVSCLNLATTNFLDLVGNKDVEKRAMECVTKYAVGTCGPRGFYGTSDIHILLEKQIASWCGTEEAIAYSYGFSTFSSVIMAYAKRQDIIFVDEGVSLPIQIGIKASRSKLYWFKHNNLDDLEHYLKQVEALELLEPSKYKRVRKFIVVEGIYLNYGDAVDLNKVIELKYKYKARVFMDESLSIGTFGKTGRGITQHCNVDVRDVDLISFSFENAFSSIGGVCIGGSYLIDHQRLSGLGYVFSASNPTFLCQAVVDALSYIDHHPEICEQLRQNSQVFYQAITESMGSAMRVDGVPGSPVLHLRFPRYPISTEERQEQSCVLDKIVDQCLHHGVMLLRPRYVEEKEHILPSPSIRICLNSALTSEEIKHSVNSITSAVHLALKYSENMDSTSDPSSPPPIYPH